MLTAAILFTLAAMGGAVLASFPLRGIPRPPTWLALGHGAVAVLGFAALIYHAMTSTPTLWTQYAAGTLVLAAVGGAMLFFGFHLRQKPLPVPLVLGHGLAALCGVVLSWISVYYGG
jgi:hypothetical protein